MVRFDTAGADEPRLRQRPKLPPFSRSSVRPLSRFLRDWSTWKMPAVNLPFCVLPRAPVALTSWTVPRLVSRIDPVGIWRASSRGTKSSPFWLARAPRPCAPARAWTATSTVPLTTSTFTSLPTVGAGRSSRLISGGGSNRIPAGENVVANERVTDPPPGTVTFQLMPMPLSWDTVHSQVLGYGPAGDVAAP